jgi:DNA-binding XRE family transcriptional regulator
MSDPSRPVPGRLSAPSMRASAGPDVPMPVPAGSGGTRPVQPWTTVLDGQRLRQLRHKNGLSQEGLADQAGLSLATIARLERSLLPNCRCRTLARLAAALGERPADLTPPPPI